MKRAVFLIVLSALLLPAADDVRPYLQTGPWYPADPARLKQMLDGFFKGLPPAPAGNDVRAIIAPHAGYDYSGRCAAKAYAALSPAQGIRRVVLLGSSHRSAFHGACVDDSGAWSTPLGTIALDQGICRELAAKKFFRADRNAMRLEHSLENQLPFLQTALKAAPSRSDGIPADPEGPPQGDAATTAARRGDGVLPGGGFKIVPILFGSLNRGDYAPMAAAIAPYVDGQTLVVVSSDLTHYGENFSYTPFRRDLAANLSKLDRGFIDAVLRRDFDGAFAYRAKTGITVCGFVPIGVMLRLFEKNTLSSALADYYTSGDLTGDYSTSVSYASLVFTAGGSGADDPIGLEDSERKMLLELARFTLRSYLTNGREPLLNEKAFSLHPRLEQKLGVFVTLRKKGELRGCIGTIVGVEPLFRGVVANAVHAAVDDPRFTPLSAAELPAVEIEISVMTPLRPLADYRAIRLGTDGVIIRDGDAQAVFLPQVATETGWSLDEFLGRLCLKAGLARDAYRRSPSMRFLVFQAQVFGEKGSAK